MSERTSLQRKKATANEVPPTVQEVLSSSGQPLNAATRDFMEPRFSHDFSQVRVHTDERAAKSAQDVNALAYTVGQDVVFGASQYAPETAGGQHLLAHELAHVVQQATGQVTKTPDAGGFSVSDPADNLEYAADKVAHQVLTSSTQNTETPTFTGAVQRYTNHTYIQRFQAGGHEELERDALMASGFSSDDTSKVYFGNWLRDLSQVSPKALPLINILALGEFGREVTTEDLGTYIPSEHLDNPEDGGKIEDPKTHDEKTEGKLSSAQLAAYEDEQKHIAEIEAAAAASGLPEYIELGKFHAKQKLTEAINLDHTPDGMQAMGNGLHAIEDYYSHSNFVEVAIWKLFEDGKLTSKQYQGLVRTELGNDGALIGGLDPLDPYQPGIITGTYKPGANDSVSHYELLITEVENGKLTKAFVKGALKKLGITNEEILKRLGHGGEEMGTRAGQGAGEAIGGVVGAVGGGVKDGIIGAGRGAAEGWEQHSGVSAIWHAFTGFFSGGAKGVAEGANEGWHSGEKTGNSVGGMVGGVIGHVLGLAAGAGVDVLIDTLGLPFIIGLIPAIAGLMAGLVAAVKGLIEEKVQQKTEQAAKEAHDAKLSGPTHSEIAKDSPHHHLYLIAGELTKQVDYEIGKAMLTAWEENTKKNEQANTSSPASSELTESVTSLVDKYVSHPSRDLWWYDTVLVGALSE